MDPIGDISLTLTGYSQAAAAAFLVVDIALVRMLLRKYPAPRDAALEAEFRRICMSAARIVGYSICWMVVTGVLMAFFPKGRGSSAQGDPRIPATAIKYAGMVLLAGTGLISWARLSKKTRQLRSKHKRNSTG